MRRLVGAAALSQFHQLYFVFLKKSTNRDSFRIRDAVCQLQTGRKIFHRLELLKRYSSILIMIAALQTVSPTVAYPAARPHSPTPIILLSGKPGLVLYLPSAVAYGQRLLPPSAHLPLSHRHLYDMM